MCSGVPSLARDQPGQSRSFEASEENTATGFWEGQLERDLHRWLSLLSDSQPEMLICWGGRVLAAEIWASEVSLENGHRLLLPEGTRVWFATTKEVWEEGKKPAWNEVRHHFWEAHEEGGGAALGASFSWEVRSGNRAPATWIPGVGKPLLPSSLQRWVWTADAIEGPRDGLSTSYGPHLPRHSPYQGNNGQIYADERGSKYPELIHQALTKENKAIQATQGHSHI